jgi:very-short-patch-repair endonuclease
LRIAIEDVAFGAWSVPEAIIGRRLRAAHLPAFEQNARIYGPGQKLLGIVDLWWPDLRAAVEIHGAEHHMTRPDWAQTLRRTARREAHGIEVLQIPAIDVLDNLARTVTQIEHWLNRLSRRARSPTA